MAISKSSRHQKVIGEFGEHLITNMLSRSGLEVSIVDHTGLDLVAFDPVRKERLGITVKSRARSKGTEGEPVNFFRKNDRQKLIDACKFFGCVPWIAAYVESTDHADVYLTSLENYDRKYRISGAVVETWRMSKKMKEQYVEDPEVMHIELVINTHRWW